MTEREKLTNKLVKQGVFVTRNHAEVIADFILKDRKRIVEEIINLYSSEQWEGLKTLRGLL